MTSRRDVISGTRSEDELGALIRWSLQETVAEAGPPAEVWERIRAHAELPAMWRRLKSRTGYRIAMARLSRAGTFLVAQVAFWMRPRYRWEDSWAGGRLDPYCSSLLCYEPGFLWLRLAF
jgi:hypothetical protein